MRYSPRRRRFRGSRGPLNDKITSELSLYFDGCVPKRFLGEWLSIVEGEKDAWKRRRQGQELAAAL
ncbi:MAG: hypothetical protein HW398_182 [Acidobacteria bacterium]|nr:hypothetical protein [Acidobacteriota bacterium]